MLLVYCDITPRSFDHHPPPLFPSHSRPHLTPLSPSHLSPSLPPHPPPYALQLRLQSAAQRSLDRCSEAEVEVATLRARLAEAEERSTNRGSIVALETKVDGLEEEVRRAGASRVEMEGDARESLNRAKRLQGEVDMMRAEYEIVSEEASGLRGSLAGAEVCVCCLVF